MKIATAAVFAALVVLGCNDKRDQEASRGTTGSAEGAAEAPPVMSQAGRVSGIMTDASQTANAPGASPAPPSPPDRAVTTASGAQIAPSMLIRTGSASIEVDKLDPAIVKVRQLATQLGGYVANSSISGGRDQVRSATLELKIPSARYDQAVGGLGAIGRVEAVNTSVEDVGEEYVDVTARVTNAKRLEDRLVGLLANRTARLADVLAVERELARVREEIERYEGRLRYLRTRAAVSSLSVTVHEPFPLLGRHPGDNPIVGALKQAWRNFVSFISWMIASLGILVPAGLIAFGGWYAYRRVKQQ
jgi:hypothetical protein